MKTNCKHTLVRFMGKKIYCGQCDRDISQVEFDKVLEVLSPPKPSPLIKTV